MDFPLVRLDSLYKIARGGSPRPIKDFITDDPNGINWIKIGDATASGKYIYETKQKIIPEGIQRSRLVKEGDFILSNSMSFGRPYIMGISGCIHDGWLVLSAKDKSIDQDFLYYLLGSPFVFKQFDNLAAGSTVRNLNIDLVSGVKIPLLPIPEQKRIVAILDQAFAEIEKARANAEQNLKNARELFESYLQQVFSQRGEDFTETILGDIAEVKSGGTPLKSTAEFWDGDIAWYSSGELNALYTISPKEKITDLGLNGSNAKLFPKGSLLIGMYDTAALKMSILDREGAFNQAIAGVKPNNNINLIFILHAINYIKPDLLKLRRGVRQKNLNQSKIKNIPIFLPSIEKQNEVVQMLHDMNLKTEKLSEIYFNKLEALDELKKSILQKAFTGELTKEVTR
jgi:type I restriction enzyme S subunit